jgi:hypothetical protein
MGGSDHCLVWKCEVVKNVLAYCGKNNCGAELKKNKLVFFKTVFALLCFSIKRGGNKIEKCKWQKNWIGHR